MKASFVISGLLDIEIDMATAGGIRIHGHTKDTNRPSRSGFISPERCDRAGGKYLVKTWVALRVIPLS